MNESNSLTSTQSTLPPQSNASMCYQDEISLVDIWKFIARHQKLILGVTASITLVGLIAALMIPKKYEYSMTLEIGKTLERSNGEIKFNPIETPLSVKAKLESAYLPNATSQQLNDTTPQQTIPKIIVTTPKEGNIVTLSSTATITDSAPVKSIMQNAANKLVLDLNRITAADSAQLQEEIKSAKRELEKLTDNEERSANLKAEEQKILETHARLQQLENSVKAIETDIPRTDQHEKLYKTQLEEINSQITRINLQQNRSETTPKGTLNDTSKILIDNQLQQYLNRKAVIEETLLVTIPSLRENQVEKLSEKRLQIPLDQALAKQQEAKLASFIKQLERQSQSQKDTIESLEIVFNSISPSKILLEPTQSIKPKGPGKAIIIMLAAFLGLFAGLLAAFIVDLRERVKNAS